MLGNVFLRDSLLKSSRGNQTDPRIFEHNTIYH